MRSTFAIVILIVSTAFPAAAQSKKYLAYLEFYSVDSDAIATVSADGNEKPIELLDASGPLPAQTGGAIRVGHTIVTLGTTADVTDPGWVLARETAGAGTALLGGAPFETNLSSQARRVALPATVLAAGKTTTIYLNPAADDQHPLGWSVQFSEPQDPTTDEANRAENPGGVTLSLKPGESADETIPCTLSVTTRTRLERQSVPVYETFVQTADITTRVDDLTAFVVNPKDEPGRALLVLLRIRDRNHPRPAQFHVENKFIQIQGKPDWSWWTEPYAGAFEFKDGAGRVFGPIDATGFWKEIDFARVGFPDVPQNDPAIMSSPRISWVLDNRELTKRGAAGGSLFKLMWTPNLPDTGERQRKRHPIRVSEHLEAIYKALAQQPIDSFEETIPSKAVVISADVDYTENGEPIIPAPGQGDGLIMTIEADSTAQPGIYSLDQNIIVHKKKMNRSRGDWKWGDELVRGQFECDYEVKDGSTTAFLLPIKNDEFLLMLSTFTLLPQEQMPRRPYDVDIKAVLVDGTPDWETINTLDVPDALEHRDGSPIIFWPKNPYGFWNLEGMVESPERFYFKNIAATRLIWDSRAGEAKGTNGLPVGDSFWTSYPNALSPAGYRVPFSPEAQAKKKHLVGVRMASSITDTQPADPRPRGILAVYEAAETKIEGRTPPRLDEFIQLQLPVDVAETDQRAGEELFYARSDVSYKPHDNLLTVRLFPAGGSKFFLILSRFTMNNGVSLVAKGWHGEPVAQ